MAGATICRQSTTRTPARRHRSVPYSRQRQLRRRSPHVYSAEAFEGVGAGLDALERSLQGCDPATLGGQAQWVAKAVGSVLLEQRCADACQARLLPVLHRRCVRASSRMTPFSSSFAGMSLVSGCLSLAFALRRRMSIHWRRLAFGALKLACSQQMAFLSVVDQLNELVRISQKVSLAAHSRPRT